MVLKKIFSLIFLANVLAHTLVCMESEVSKLMTLLLPWIDQQEQVLKTIAETQISKSGIQKIYCEGVEAEFRREDTMVYLSSDKVSECMNYETFLHYLGINQKQTTPAQTNQKHARVWCISQ